MQSVRWSEGSVLSSCVAINLASGAGCILHERAMTESEEDGCLACLRAAFVLPDGSVASAAPCRGGELQFHRESCRSCEPRGHEVCSLLRCESFPLHAPRSMAYVDWWREESSVGASGMRLGRGLGGADGRCVEPGGQRRWELLDRWHGRGEWLGWGAASWAARGARGARHRERVEHNR